MGFGNTAPVVDAITVSPTPVPAGASATVTCSAHDGASVMAMRITVSDGTLDGGATAVDVAIAPGASVSGSATWATPPAGAYTVGCTVTDGGGATSGPLSATATVPVQVEDASPPAITSLAGDAAQVFPGDVVAFTAAIAAPSGGALTVTWSATAGAVAPAGATATWTAPEAPGRYVISVTAANAAGEASASAAVDVVWARGAGTMSGEAQRGFVPERVAVDAAGYVWVSNARGGTIHVLTPRGEPLRTIATGGRISGVAVGRDGVWVADLDRGAVDLVDRTGRRLRSLGRGAGELRRPVDVAVNPATEAVYVADADARAVRVFDLSGRAVATLAVAGGIPAGVAVDPVTGRVYVTDTAASLVRVFDGAGVQLGSIGSYGGDAGQLLRAAGVAVGRDGLVYVVDAYASRISAFTAAGAFVAQVGEAEAAAGRLAVPIGIAADAAGRLVVTSTETGKVEVFALRGAVAPACPVGDADCDGMLDASELLHGLDPTDPRDAAADADGDGLENGDELALGTDPRVADTDGDGFPDGEELATGYDPRDGGDHRPVFTASAPARSAPGLVRVSSAIRSESACTTSWRQVDGPPVVLRGASSGAPAFVARAAATYALQGVARCGAATSEAVVVMTTVANVAPRADAGRVAVIEKGDTVVLDGRFSADANDDALELAWDQTLGKPVTGAVAGATLSLRLREPGLYAFQLSATDGDLSSAGDVEVLAVEPNRQAPTAVASSPVLAEVGAPVALDATASAAVSGHALSFVWVQLDGPEVVLDRPGSATPTFVPPAAARYVFAVSAVDGARRSPSARVEVYARAPGAALPAAAARVSSRATGVAPVGEPVELDGTASTAAAGGALSFEWRQVSGPPAGLTDADARVATVVPFSPGRYVFQLAVSEGVVRGVPATVELVAGAVPAAAARAPASARVRDRVVLDATGSTGGSAALRYRWTQVAGPWVAVASLGDGSRAEVRPLTPGRYVFEVEVDDGAVRSAPAAVTVDVSPARQDAGAQEGK